MRYLLAILIYSIPLTGASKTLVCVCIVQNRSSAFIIPALNKIYDVLSFSSPVGAGRFYNKIIPIEITWLLLIETGSAYKIMIRRLRDKSWVFFNCAEANKASSKNLLTNSFAPRGGLLALVAPER